MQASCGSAAAVFSTTALYPLEISKARLVTSVGKGGKGTLAILEEIVKKHGPLALYRGLGIKCAHAVVQNFGFYYIYSFLSGNIRRRRGGKPLGTVTNLGVGYIAGVGNLALSLPFEVITMRMQVSNGKSFTQTVRDLYRDGSISAFYRGVLACVLLCINPAIYNTVFDQLKNRLLARAAAAKAPGAAKAIALTTLQAFALGIIAKAVATLLTYPYIRAKMVLQASKKKKKASPAGEGAGSGGGAGEAADGAGSDRAESAVAVIQHIIRTEGLPGLFKGLQVQLLRSTLSSALMLMAKERIYFYTRSLLLSMSGAE